MWRKVILSYTTERAYIFQRYLFEKQTTNLFFFYKKNDEK